MSPATDQRSLHRVKIASLFQFGSAILGLWSFVAGLVPGGEIMVSRNVCAEVQRVLYSARGVGYLSPVSDRTAALASACLREIELYNGLRPGVVLDYRNRYAADLSSKFWDFIIEAAGCKRTVAANSWCLSDLWRSQRPARRPDSGFGAVRENFDTVISSGL